MRRWAGACAAGVVVAGCESGTGPGACGSDPATIALEPQGSTTILRLDDGFLVDVSVANECGQPVFVGDPVWSTSDSSVVTARAVTGAMTPAGYVEARSFGSATVFAAAGEATAAFEVDVVKPATRASGFAVLGSGAVGRFTTDLWVHGSHAYTGSGPTRCGGEAVACEDLPGFVYVWSLSAGGGIAPVDSVALPAPRVNDVKVSADGTFLVASQEGDRRDNGIVILDLADPGAPALVSHYTNGLEEGVHNVWIERIGGRDYVFVVEDGSASGGLHILDVTDRSAPVEVSRFYGGSSTVHDVYVRDGLAFVSHWDAGLVIVDVGNAASGGAPDNPVEVGRVVTSGGNVHNAWYWPERSLVFVGEERLGSAGDVGVLHVIDASSLTAPREIAVFGVEGETPHNFWLDEDRGILFAAWYREGLRAIDVTGTLSGDLSAQGRDLGHVIPSGARGAASAWAPQLHDGLVYLSDIFNGIWAVRFDGAAGLGR